MAKRKKASSENPKGSMVKGHHLFGASLLVLVVGVTGMRYAPVVYTGFNSMVAHVAKWGRAVVTELNKPLPVHSPPTFLYKGIPVTYETSAYSHYFYLTIDNDQIEMRDNGKDWSLSSAIPERNYTDYIKIVTKDNTTMLRNGLKRVNFWGEPLGLKDCTKTINGAVIASGQDVLNELEQRYNPLLHDLYRAMLQHTQSAGLEKLLEQK